MLLTTFSSVTNNSYTRFVLTCALERSLTWKSKRFSAYQEIPWIFWTPNFIASFSCTQHLFLSWAISIQFIPTSNFVMIYRNIIIAFKLVSTKWSISLRYPHQNPVYASPLHHSAACSANVIRLDFITWKLFGEEYRWLTSTLCSFLHFFFTSSLLVPNTLLSTLL